MGTDTPIAALSDRPRLLFDYFQQLFAQVTNPPLDAIREELVTSLGSHTSVPEGNLLDPSPASCRQIVLPHPILTNDRSRQAALHQRGRRPAGLPPVRGRRAVSGRGRRRRTATGARTTSARRSATRSPTAPRSSSSPTATRTRSWRRSRRCCSSSAVHHHLIREKTRTKVGLVVECGDAREVHHMALLLGYGAAAVNPYLAFETIEDLINEGFLPGLSEGSGRAQLHQGVRQGRPQGHVEDGDLDGRVVHRCAGLRGDRARRRTSSTSTSAARRRSSAASAST